MSNPATSPDNPKYGWCAIAREGLPKRPAGERVDDFEEIYGVPDEAAIRAQAARCVQCNHPECMKGCPLANRIPEWMALAAEGRFLEAAEISRTTSNFPEICSRLCPQERLCEEACLLTGKNDAVAIGIVERFINDYALAHGAVEAVQVEPNGFRVAVVGSGPGGLACADELIQRGYAVTVFESMLVPGGLLVNGIPAFKLTKTIVARRIELMQRRGVNFRLGVEIGRDISLAELRAAHDAVFLAFGAQRPKPLDVPGANLAGVTAALPFLIQKNVPSPLVELPAVDVAGKRVTVLGGGDTAMDCLRTALRSGASEAVCLYRRDLANMPGSRKEYANALEEGARFEFLTNPVEVVGNAAGAVSGVKCVRMELGAPDKSGRRSPKPVAGSEFFVAADIAIVAYGFDPVPFASDDAAAPLATDRWGSLKVDANQMTSLPGVFSGGDSVRGPSLVVHAVRDARKAARAIDEFLTTLKAK
jgi:glutamate synthase (NADPH/NADH) small chain